MTNTIAYFSGLLHAVFSSYFSPEKEEKTGLFLPESQWLKTLLPENTDPTKEEQTVLLLALIPHLSPQTLDLFFLQNKALDRPYTEFGGWKGVSHGGFLPTGETAAFLLSATQLGDREKVMHLFGKDHWFYRNNILRLESQGEGEPFLSGRLVISDEVLAKVYGQEYEPEYNATFPAKKITTLLEWNDLVLPYNLREELDDIICWIKNQHVIREQWALNKIIKQGYRCLFYGPPGTGKTLTATLLGKQNNMDVYRVDLSMIVSKYIGDTEKNLAKIFDKAEHQYWILFFDEADALFGQRTETQSSNDRHANQEVAYLLQRIEDFPGTVILASNLKENIDEAFFRRFQSALYFPMPDERLRYQLWQKMLPGEWLPADADEFLQQAAKHKLSGGSMVNVIQHCAIGLFDKESPKLSPEQLKQAIVREQAKDGKIIN
ncbi:MAG: ATP-binding protein [Prevotellaceae bacterium]|jgi:adenylate kinase family enzyme|nr:ATP-binding protein [Prevotellaceae bacterium]